MHRRRHRHGGLGLRGSTGEERWHRSRTVESMRPSSRFQDSGQLGFQRIASRRRWRRHHVSPALPVFFANQAARRICLQAVDAPKLPVVQASLAFKTWCISRLACGTAGTSWRRDREVLCFGGCSWSCGQLRCHHRRDDNGRRDHDALGALDTSQAALSIFR